MTEHMSIKEYKKVLQKRMKSKYRNEPVTIEGIWFRSTREGIRYTELKLLEQSGAIIELELQPKFSFPPVYDSGRHIVYIADFQYIDADTATRVIEDVKGAKTHAYKMKRAMMKYFHGITITEV